MFRWSTLPALLVALFMVAGCSGGDDDTQTGDDDTQTGDDDTQTGDDDTQAGDDDSQSGDDDSPSGDDDTSSVCNDQTVVGWSSESHEKGAVQNYGLVFPDDVVNRLDITICAEDYQAMLDDMTELYGVFGEGGDEGPPPGGGPPPAVRAEVDQGEPVDDPIYVPVSIAFEDKAWAYVGMRFKGNSSLRSSWQSGISKLPFRLAFDKYEDDYPEIDNQRFWGFKEVKFGNGYMDQSLIRDKIGAETFRDAGIPAPVGAFYRIFVDSGEGPVYWGLYTMFEDICNEHLETWFDSDNGNCYKPDQGSADWTYYDASDWEKKTNEDEADWSDVEAAVGALLATGLDAADWRAGLETYFDTDLFLRYLALNNLMASWDVYGNAAHNYYLYGDPADEGRLKWMPWDYNMSYMLVSVRTPLSLTMEEVSGEDWPLIRSLIDDPVYADYYYAQLADLLTDVYTTGVQFERMQTYHTLITEYAIGETGEQAPFTHLESDEAFQQALTDGTDALKPLVESQISDANTVLNARD